MEANIDMPSDVDPISNAIEYCKVVGSLQYLTLSHLDITYLVNKLAQFMKNWRPMHRMAMKRVLCYLSEDTQGK